jgi:hypothetical protein
MKFNHLALVTYAVITVIFILLLEWGVNLPFPEFSQSTRQEYQQIGFLNDRLIPLVGVLLAVVTVRVINKLRFHVSEATTATTVAGLLFIILKPALGFIGSMELVLFAALIGTISIFYLYQATSCYFRKSVTI